jgi:hypothetical protein
MFPVILITPTPALIPGEFAFGPPVTFPMTVSVAADVTDIPAGPLNAVPPVTLPVTISSPLDSTTA